MSEQSYKRRLSAILFANACGYSRLAARDECIAVARLAEYRALIDGIVSAHHGRAVDASVESILAEFPSAVHAVNCAIAMQREIAGRNSLLPKSLRLEFRVGLNLGDVLVKADAVFGDGVNVAARVESLAPPGGVCLTGALYEAARGKLPVEFVSLGEHSLKNIVEPVSLYAVRLSGERILPRTKAPQRPLSRIRVSIACAPLVVLGESSELQQIADDLGEDLITDLCKFRDTVRLMMVGADLVGKGRATQWRALSEVHYLLGGSVRRAGDHVRIQMRLIDTRSGQVAWGNHYDRHFDALRRCGDDVVQMAVATIAAQIEQVEYRHALHGSDENREAFDCFLLGKSSARQFTQQGNHAARQLYEEAIRLNPKYARAHAALSRTHNFDWRYAWTDSPDRSLENALTFAQRALDLDPYDPRGHAELGYVHLFMCQHQRAIADYERALALNPNDTDVMADMADALSYNGRAEEAVALLESSLRLNPVDPDWRLWSLGDAHYVSRDYRAVIATLGQMHNPDESHRLLAASYAQIDMLDHAAAHAREVLKRQPDFTAARWAAIQPESSPEDTEHYFEGLRKAGL